MMSACRSAYWMCVYALNMQHAMLVIPLINILDICNCTNKNAQLKCGLQE